MAEFCGRRCPTYAEVVDRLRKSCPNTIPGFEHSTGDCSGVFRVTVERGPFGGGQMYFDDKGVLIGGIRNTDYAAYCNGLSPTEQAGTIPTCPDELKMEALCSTGAAGPRPSAAASQR
jgi:hypothetical protein